jgi:hypothetical protein
VINHARGQLDALVDFARAGGKADHGRALVWRRSVPD